MIFRTLIVGTALAIAMIALPAHSAEQPRLRALVTVQASLVTLGDLIENAGEASGIAVFRAPDLGTTGTVRATRILAAATANGVADLDSGGIESVSVSRSGRVIDAEEVTRVLGRQLVEINKVARLENLDITLDGFKEPIVVESESTATLTVGSFDYDTRNGRFSAMLTIADSRAAAAGYRVTGRAIEIIEVPVLAHTVERGELILSSDIVIERMPGNSVRADAITDAANLAGMAARRRLRSGDVVTPVMLMEPILVQRGDLVTIVFRSPGLTLTTRGRSLSAGARGDVISVMNVQAKRSVEAEVTGAGIVTVMPQRVPVASLPTTVN